MNGKIVTNEFAKMRHLHVWLIAALLLVVTTGFALYTGVFSPDFDRATGGAWNSLLNSFGGVAPLVSPLLLAIMASRLVDIEHVGGGWLMSSVSGATSGALCRAKMLALAVLVVVATVAASVLVAATGFLTGIEAPWPAGRWIGLTVMILIVNLVLVALAVIIAARVENQLVGIGIGLLGTVLGLIASSMPAWFVHLTPWGYYTLAAVTGYDDAELVAVTPSYLSIAGLAIVTIVAFSIFTSRFDRQEA